MAENTVNDLVIHKRKLKPKKSNLPLTTKQKLFSKLADFANAGDMSKYKKVRKQLQKLSS